ncbi:ferritin-like fold-containing protein [Arthrobacter crystallopoietes]|uniref:ferritin-like fold-containing protein n=1 Tax=Crystallibacter crystallopoietes TaxID=37928 RepID=UPI003D220CD4
MSTEEQPAGAPAAGTDEVHRQYVIDLYGVMAYGELSAFERFSSDARFSPTLRDRAEIGRVAVIEFEHFEMVRAELARMGVDVQTAMLPFQASIDAFHERTRPGDWYESLMKAYVADAVSGDFYRAIASRLDPQTREVVASIKENKEQLDLLTTRLAQALQGNERLASRLALWGRRLVGEALTQAQRIGIERSFLGGLLGFDEPGTQETVIAELFAELTRNHSRRMNALGLTA